MKKYLLSLITLTLLLSAPSFPGGKVFAATTYTLSADHKTLTITSSGAMDDLTSSNYTTRGWNSYATTITKIIINNTVTAIGDYAFKGMTSVTTVTFNSTSKVATIGQYAFDGCTGITSFSLPNSLTTIGYYAFKGCTGISSITIPKNVTICGEQAFTGCSNLTTVNWNAVNCTEYKSGSQFSSSWGPFYNSTIRNQITTFKFGSDVEVIPPYICYNFKNLAEIKIPLKVTEIGASAFQNCTTAVALEIPVAVETIGANAFNGCTGLTKILARPATEPTASANTFTDVTTTIPVTVTSSAAASSYAGATGWNVFTNYTTRRSGSCGTSANWELDYAAGTLTITGSGPTTDYGSYSEVPWIQDTSFIYTASVANAITRLGNRTFYGCQRLTNVSISSSQLTSIGQYAMYKCIRLVGFGNNASQINIPKDVTSIDNYAFQYCSSATKVYFMSTSALTTIGSYAFQYMSNLNDVAIYNCDNLTTINSNAFQYCSSLASITFPANIATIGSSAFANCTSLTPEGGSVNFKGTVDQWASIAFSGQASNPASYTKALKINGDLLTSCTISVPVKQYAFHSNEALTSIEFTEGCTSIGGNAFVNCINLEGTVVIPSALTELGTWAFKNCSSLTGVDMLHADALTTIGGSAFWETNLQGELYIPAGVTSVGGSAFRDITGITAIYASPTTAPSSLNEYTFNTTTKTIPFYVATPSALTSYSTANYWEDFTNMKVGGYCGATGNETGVKWEFNTSTGLLTISGTGAMKDYTNANTNRAPWYDLRASVTSIKICDNVTHVGAYAFNACSNATEVWTSTTVTSFGNHAFYSCSQLNVAKYGKTDVPTPVLSYATDWAQIDFGDEYANPLYYAHTLKIYKAQSAAAPAFGTVTDLENRSITTIKPYAFYGCTSLESAALNSNVTSIDKYAFNGCSNLASVTLPDNIETLGYHAFYGCSSLSSITIPQNVTKVGDAMFQGCSSLTTVVWNAENCSRCFGSSSEQPLSSSYNPFYTTSASNPPRSTITSFTFGSNVVTIPNGLCYNMVGLTSISIPASVTSIGTNVFQGCSNLHSIHWNARNCGDFTSSTAPFESIKTAITSFEFGFGVRHIPAYLCKDMNNITYPYSSTYGVTIPTTVESIGTDAFDGCTNFNRTDFKASNSYAITYVDDWGQINFANEKANPLYYSGHLYVVIPPSGQSTPGPGEVRTPVFKDTTTYINSYAFVNCTNITSVTFGSSMSSIAANAFDGCTGITEVHSKATSVPTLSSSAFPAAVKSSAKLYLPHSVTVKANYRANEQWNDFTEANTFPKIVQFDLKGNGDAMSTEYAAQYFDNITSAASKPADPTDDVYAFEGWFENNDCSGSEYNFSTTITADKILYAKWTLQDLNLNEAADNSAAITAFNGVTTTVNITRSAFTNASYNTICLPFALSAGQMNAIFGAGYDLEEFTGATYDAENKEIALTFTQRETLVAGRPYLLKPANDNVTIPSLTDMTINATTPSDGVGNSYIEFHGVYSPTELEGGNHNLLFLGAGNELFWPAATGDLKGFRAYFEVKGDARNAVRARIVSHTGETTGIENQMVNGKCENGKYIRNGQLFIERDGKTYNAQGILVE